MDRRDFCKSVLVMPLLSPAFHSSKRTRGDFELQLITSFPHRFIIPLLQEIQKHGLFQGQYFTTINSHPQKEDLIKVLSKNSWSKVQNPSQADLVFTFGRLVKPAPGSFTVIRREKVLDIRINRLLSLWQEMNKNQRPSSWLTTASSPPRRSKLSRGHKASVYADGHQVETLSLKKDCTKSYPTTRGRVDVFVKDGEARVVDSSCPQKICLHTPPIALEGERIICAPNHFLIKIESRYSLDTVIG